MGENLAIGFIGIGVMGKSMAMHLLNANHEVHIYTRTKAKADELLVKGAIWEDSPKSIARKCNFIITMVGYPKDVEEVYFQDGILDHAKAGTYCIDMTTSSPTLAKKIANAAKSNNLFALDAPVSGGDIGAKNAQLAIMVGGEKEVFEKALPILQLLGTNIKLQGTAGAGQYTKMCNQIVIASNMMGVCEAIVYAKKVGLDPTSVLDSISTGAAGSWSLSNLAPRIIKGDYTPGFFVKHFIKDMKIALDSAEEMQLQLPGLALSKTLYEKLAQNGGENYGTQALIQVLENN